MSRELRRKLRRNPSPVERRFWRIIHPLRTNGWHFRKQVEIGPYYVDFACLHAGLVVEVDGFSHDNPIAQGNDEQRDRYLADRGFQVLRIANADVLQRPEGVYTLIVAALEGRTGNRRGSPPPQEPFEHSSHGLLTFDRSTGATFPSGRLEAPQGGGCQAGDCESI